MHEFIYDNCDSNLTIRDLLYDVLLHFKTTLKAKNIILIIKNIDQGFTLHVPKRNGKPNEDFPGIFFIKSIKAFDFKVSLS